MKRTIAQAGALFAAFAMLHLASAEEQPQHIIIEAESAYRLVAPMRVGVERAPDGSPFIEVPPSRPGDRIVEGAGKAYLRLHVQKPGTYQFWFLTKWFNGCANSLNVQIIGIDARQSSAGGDGLFNAWHWIKGPERRLEPGIYELCVSSPTSDLGEAEAMQLDKILVTDDARFVPEDKEIGYATTFFYEGLDKAWETRGGEWGRTQAQCFSLRVDSPGEALAVVGETWWSNYAVEVTMCAEKPGIAGLLFYYHDPANYYRVEVAEPKTSGTAERNRTGSIRLWKKENGIEKLLSREVEVAAPSKWTSLRAELFNANIKVYYAEHEIFDLNDFTFSEGKAGLYVKGVRNFLFDDFGVQSIKKFYDSFAGYRAEELGIWEVKDGKWQAIQPSADVGGDMSHCLFQSSKETAMALIGLPAWRDYTASALIRSSGKGSMGLIFDFQDERTYLGVEWNSAGSTATRQIILCNNGVKEVLAGDQAALEPDAWYNMQIKTAENRIKVYCDNSLIFKTDRNPLRHGRFGLFSAGSEGTYFDDVEITFNPADTVFDYPLFYSEYAARSVSNWDYPEKLWRLDKYVSVDTTAARDAKPAIAWHRRALPDEYDFSMRVLCTPSDAIQIRVGEEIPSLNFAPYLPGEYQIMIAVAAEGEEPNARFVLDGPQVNTVWVEENGVKQKTWQTAGRFLKPDNLDKTLEILLRKRKQNLDLVIQGETVASYELQRAQRLPRLGIGFKGKYSLQKMRIQSLD